MSLQETFRDDVERYLSALAITPTAFGLAAVNDPGFVFDLRKGRSPSARLMDRVRAYIAAHPAPPGEERAA